jgi:alpha-galactosidase
VTTPRLHLARVEAEIDGEVWSADLGGAGPATLGPLEVTVTAHEHGSVAWSIANRADGPVRVRAVSLVFDVVDVAGPLRMFRHGYQSWSPTGVATLGVATDPSTIADFPFLQAVHHADQRTVTRPGELRSEWVTLLVDDRHAPVLVGFERGDGHDGTLRLAPVDAPRRALLRAEAFLGDAVLAAGAERPLHALVIEDVAEAGATSAGDLLDRWAHAAGGAAGARVGGPYEVGWCSWYQYFGGVTEEVVLRNLAGAGAWPFDLFQLDDGFQPAIGDWLEPGPGFPHGVEGVADAVTAAGKVAGIWLAPFLVAPTSRLAAAHPGWQARTVDGRHPLRAWWNPEWNGGDDGFLHALDTTHPEVLAHLEALAADLVSMGFRYLKLDFTFAPAVDGRWHDPARTPAERVRAGYDAIRGGAGDDTVILACGAPLAPVVGVVDACRIGPDVAPLWSLDRSAEIVRGYLGIQPATRHAYVNTATRAFMHRRLWRNDPDCLLLRPTDTALAPQAARGWARAVGLSGGSALVSDDLALLGAPERALLDEAVALGRASDAAARAGGHVEVPDLLDAREPTVLEAAGHRLVLDPATGAARLTTVEAGTPDHG